MRNANARRNMMCRLAVEWIKVHRPDVKAVIDAEVSKLYPARPHGAQAIPLPKILAKLK
jgi:hypothetical protein